MIYLVCNTFVHADAYARRRKMTPHQWRYVTDARDLFGIGGEDEVIFLAGANERPDYWTLRDVAASRGKT